MKKLTSVLALLALWLASTAVLAATTYTFSGTLNGSTFPTCSSSGGWAVSGTTYTCGNTISLAYGDSIIAPSSAIAIVANLSSTSGDITVANTSITGALTSTTGAIKLTNVALTGSLTTSGTVSLSGVSVSGNVTGANGVTATSGTTIGGYIKSTNGSISLTGGSVTGNVTGANGVTTSGTVIGGNVLATNGAISLTGGSVKGSVQTDCCTLTTNYTDIGGGVITTDIGSGHSTVTITGGTISGDISTSGGDGVIITGATITGGTITTHNVRINISNSSLGTVTPVTITAPWWYGSLTITNSTVIGTCYPANAACNRGAVTTKAATALAATAARLNGTVSSNGLTTSVSFEYGLTTAYGSTTTSSTVASSAADDTAFFADVAGLACETTYHFRAVATNRDGTIYGGDLAFVTSTCPVFCKPPSNIPTGVTVSCVCDTFGRTTLNPSTIFGGTWALSNSDKISDPYINQTTGFLRLTENTTKNAKAATVPGVFPAAGNYISIEFNHYAYNGTSTGADGVAVTLSDYSIPAVPGAFGGSLGYAQKSYGSSSDCTTTGGCPGFAGGWLGVGLDELGNYTVASEGRVGGYTTAQSQSIGVRGPGSAQNGYRWMGGALGVNGISTSGKTPAPGYMYQVIVDSRNSASGTVNVQVNRDSTNKDGSSYSTLFGPFNAYTEANIALTQGWISKVIPDYWKVSFTGSTGSYTDIHEIDSLRICAQTVYPSTGGIASGFSAIDEAYSSTTTPPAYQAFQTGDIFMKVAGKSFKLWVAALTTSTATPPISGLATTYALASNKFVQVKLVDNSDNVCGSDAARTCNPACTGKAAVETGGSQTVTFSQGNTTGAVLSSSFTLNSAYKSLVAVMKECSDSSCSGTVPFTSTTAACSADTFSVRPSSFTSVTSTNANNSASSGTPTFKAGKDTFALTATTISGYTGTPQINSASVAAVAPATVAGSLSGEFPAATSGTSSSTATGTSFAYDEVGAFLLRAPDFTLARIPGVFDTDWTTVDSGADGDCVTGTSAAAYSNSKNSDGKYGCYFGIAADTAAFGRFIPDHFVVTWPGYLHAGLRRGRIQLHGSTLYLEHDGRGAQLC